MITVTTSRSADPLERRLGKDIAFAAGGRYLTRGKGGLSRPPFSDGKVLILCRDGTGMQMQVRDGMSEVFRVRFTSVKEEARTGPLRRGLFTGSADLIARLSPLLPVTREEDLPGTLVLDGIQGRRYLLGVRP
jgi:U3 small nucleolar ribonucleoprotein protein IMP4